jgi:hypothetical protein
MSEKRPGRPRKADKYGGHVAAAEDLIADRLPALLDRLFELAEGVEVQSEHPNGSIRVYSRPPDREAIRYLLDRIMGKPIERREEEHSGGLTVRVEYADAGTPSDDHLDASEAAPGPEADPPGGEAVQRAGDGPAVG